MYVRMRVGCTWSAGDSGWDSLMTSVVPARDLEPVHPETRLPLMSVCPALEGDMLRSRWDSRLPERAALH